MMDVDDPGRPGKPHVYMLAINIPPGTGLLSQADTILSYMKPNPGFLFLKF